MLILFEVKVGEVRAGEPVWACAQCSRPSLLCEDAHQTSRSWGPLDLHSVRIGPYCVFTLVHVCVSGGFMGHGQDLHNIRVRV